MGERHRIADRYIEPGGYLPGERQERTPDDLLCVAIFIGWHDDKHVMGGVRAEEAFRAFCRLINVPSVALRKIVRGEADG